jgi:UDP-galactopyranose mutase
MEIARAQETYRKWREQTSPDDITPELNLLGTIGEYQQYQEMEKVIQDALKRQPDNEALKELEQWVRGELGK